MKYKWKRVLAVVFLFIIVAGWYVTVCGIGPVKPIQDRMKLGLEMCIRDREDREDLFP